MKLDGSDVRRLTDFGCMSWAPFYHPSGQYLIFTANKLGFANFELFIVDAAGDREPVRVTFTDGFDGLPVFSPEGRRLCWTSNRTADGKSQLFLADWDDKAALAALKTSPERSAGAGVLPVSRPQERPGAEAHKQPPPPHVGGYAPENPGADLRGEDGSPASHALEGRFTRTKGPPPAAEVTLD